VGGRGGRAEHERETGLLQHRPSGVHKEGLTGSAKRYDRQLEKLVSVRHQLGRADPLDRAEGRVLLPVAAKGQAALLLQEHALRPASSTAKSTHLTCSPKRSQYTRFRSSKGFSLHFPSRTGTSLFDHAVWRTGFLLYDSATASTTTLWLAAPRTRPNSHKP